MPSTASRFPSAAAPLERRGPYRKEVAVHGGRVGENDNKNSGMRNQNFGDTKCGLAPCGRRRRAAAAVATTDRTTALLCCNGESIHENGRVQWRRRRQTARPSSNFYAAVVVAAAIFLATSVTMTAEGFAPRLSPTTCPHSSLAYSDHPQSILSAVRKRPDARANAASIAASRTQTTKKVTGAGGGRKKKSPAAASTSVTPTIDSSLSSTKVAVNVATPRRRKSNVFDQFTPECMTSPFDVDTSPQQQNGRVVNSNGVPTMGNGSTPKLNKSQICQNNKINLRLQSLLKDDTGEQENELYPDHSPQAAEQIADLKSYSKLSEEARRKANLAVKSGSDDEDGPDNVEGAKTKAGRRRGSGMANATNKRGGEGGDEEATSTMGRVTLEPRRLLKGKRRVRATVKETGSDSISTYIKSLGQHELLYKEDEVLLGRQVRLLSQLEEKRYELEEELLRPPTFAQWAEATNHTVPSLKQQIRRSQRAKAALIEANLRLVITVARQATKRSPLRQSNGANSIQFQDACQQGIIGLTRATEKFDPELGFRFSTYAIWWIQKEVAKNVSEQSRSVRLPPGAIKKINDIRIQERILMTELGRKPDDEEVAKRVGMSVQKLEFYKRSANEVTSLDKSIDARKGKGSMSSGGDGSDGKTMDAFVKDTDHPSPQELVDQQMMKDDIRRLVKTLSPREQAVIRLRFGLDDGKPLGLSDISAKFGVETQLVKKIEARALLKLRQPSRSQVVKCYISDHGV